MQLHGVVVCGMFLSLSVSVAHAQQAAPVAPEVMIGPAPAPPAPRVVPATPAPPSPPVLSPPGTTAPGAAPGRPWPAPVTPHVEGYRLQMALADLSSVALALSYRTTGSIGPSLGAAGYLLAGSVIHGVHGEDSHVLAGLGLRVGLPLGGLIFGALIGLSNGSGNSYSDSDGALGAAFGGLIGAGVGVVAAMFLDDVFLSGDRDAAPAWAAPHGPPGGPPGGPPRGPPRGPPMMPRVWMTAQQAGVGVGGRF